MKKKKRSFSELFFFFFLSPDPKSGQKSRKSTNKKNLALTACELPWKYMGFHQLKSCSTDFMQ